ncbi:hypothetical protein PPERSA_04816 [Pseudocohnilembus persalinus]|uniref:Uncharacterized protein n=1 Tax=Pseudocohnilembus persalinus TaxID=266149 RepID=A0A0V0QLB7_PSEPJ|nr:hypothetical protein PPERSA_04816 [Pseudocohnilembus persalinus]|eukprot:KRX03021.1 hypothetical protein PPERSA_04816 [Pseudocohnilembus persalinus]
MKNPNIREWEQQIMQIIKTDKNIDYMYNDQILPYRKLLQAQVSKVTKFGKYLENQINLFLGLTQIIISKDPQARQILEVIPIKQDIFQLKEDKKESNYHNKCAWIKNKIQIHIRQLF